MAERRDSCAAPPAGFNRTTLKRVVFLFGLLLAGPQAARGESLLDLYHAALAHDARWRSAVAGHQAGIEKLPQGYAALLPSVDLTGSSIHYDTDVQYSGTTSLTGGERSYATREYGVNINFPLYRKQNFAVYRQSVAQTSLADAQLAAAKADVMLRVTQGYFDLLLAQANVDLSEAEVAAYAAELDQANNRFAAGAAAITDVHEAKARLGLARAREIAAQSDLTIKRQAVRRLTGSVVGEIPGINPGFVPQPPEPNDVAQWVEMTVRQNAQVNAQREALGVAEWEVERARGAHHPTLDLIAGYTVSKSNSSVYTNAISDDQVARYGVQLQLPLFRGGGLGSKVQEASANKEKAREDLEDVRQESELQAHQAYLAAIGGISQIQALGEALVSAQSALESSRLGLRAGFRTQVDVLNAEQQLFNIKRELVRTRHDYLLNMLKLKATAGTLREEDLAGLSALLVYAREAPAGESLPRP